MRRLLRLPGLERLCVLAPPQTLARQPIFGLCPWAPSATEAILLGESSRGALVPWRALCVVVAGALTLGREAKRETDPIALALQRRIRAMARTAPTNEGA